MGLIVDVANRIAGSAFSVNGVDQLSALREGAEISGVDWEDVKRAVDFTAFKDEAESIVGNSGADLNGRLAAIRFLGDESGGLGIGQFERIVGAESVPEALIVEAVARVSEPVFLLDRIDGFPVDAIQ